MATAGKAETEATLLSAAADAESAWLQAEIAALGPDPDAAALAAFEARCEERMRVFRAETDRRIADLERAHQAALRDAAMPAGPVLTRGRAIAVIVLLAGLLAGVLLELSIGEVFLFSRSKDYFAAAPWVFLGLLLPLGWALAGRTARRELELRYPTWAVRWLLVYPLSVAVSAGAIIVAPLGWAALAGWALGAPAVAEARVVSVDAGSGSALRCRTKGRLRIAGQEGNVCLSRLVADGRLPKPGEDLQVSGLSSAFGMLLRQVRVR